MSFFGSIAQQTTFGPGGTTAGARGAWFATPQFAGLHLGAVAGGAGSHGGVAANLASANKIGGLSVPQTWAGSPGAAEEAATQAMSRRLRHRPARRRRAACCAACPWAPAAGARAPRGHPANTASNAACSPAHRPPDNATMPIGNGGRCADWTESHSVNSVSRDTLWQSGTGDWKRRSAGFIRDGILSSSELAATRVAEGTRRPGPATLTVDRWHARPLSQVMVARSVRPSGRGLAVATRRRRQRRIGRRQPPTSPNSRSARAN